MLANFAAVVGAANWLLVRTCPAVATAPFPSASAKGAVSHVTGLLGDALWLFPSGCSTRGTLARVLVCHGFLAVRCVADRVNTTRVPLSDYSTHGTEERRSPFAAAR